MQFTIPKIVLAIAIAMTSSVTFAAAGDGETPHTPVQCCSQENCTDCLDHWYAACTTCEMNVSLPSTNSTYLHVSAFARG